jgi:glycosyltransferase involved in cell wall biosynthesis
MKIVHITPHLPPDQAANALLPFQLGEWAAARGDSVHYLAHPPASGAADARPQAAAGARSEPRDEPGPRASGVENVTWIPRTKRSIWQRTLRVGSIAGAWRITRDAEPVISSADIVHVHSNGLLPEVGARIAHRLGKPVVLTLYGTEIWHYRRKSFGPDLFTRAYSRADAVTFYSQRLLERARELGLDRPRSFTVYPAVAPAFAFHDAAAQLAERRGLGLTAANLLINVKRLHPLAGQRYLLDALPEVVREHPDTQLVICGTGALLPELQAVARSAGVERHVTFAGLLDNALVARYCAAADLFVLPSLLEALPTVAVEALACGTPVVSSDNPGGVELNGVFGEDVAVVPKERPAALAGAIRAALGQKRRTHPSTQTIVERRFRADAVARQYFDIYAEVMRR